MKILLKLIFLFNVIFCYAQNSETVILENREYSFEKHKPKRDVRYVEYKNRVNDVLKATKITYYGLDLSFLVLTNRKKWGEEEKLRKYNMAWPYAFYEKVTSKKIEKLFSKKKDNFSLAISLKSTNKLNASKSGEWISYDDFTLDVLDVVKEVESYKLDEKEGVGFVVIGENFNKETTRVSVFYTFFDIKTREVLWSVRVIMAPTGSGMTGYWAGGIADTFIIFKEKVYSRHIK